MKGEEYACVETIRDSYLFQHITEPTRGRGSTEPYILDLVFTNEEGMVENINHQSPLRKSDHCVIECNFNCNCEEHQRSYKKYYYDTGDYEGMRNDLNIDWDDYLGQEDHIETQWNKFVDIVKSAFSPEQFYQQAPVRQGYKDGDQQQTPKLAKIHRNRR